LVASNRLSGRHEDHAIPIPDSEERVLRTAVLYGANGAGKSNLFKALQYVKSIALDTRPKNGGTGRDAFRFGGIAHEPSVFDLRFIVANRFYRLGFTIDDHQIREEWLVQLIGGRERTIYERVTSDDGSVTIRAPGLEGVKLRALATIGGPQNQSFLATIQATLELADLGDELGGIFYWFRYDLNLMAPGEPLSYLQRMLSRDPDLVEFAGDFLRASSTGVDHLVILRSTISSQEFDSLFSRRDLSKGLGQGLDGSSIFVVADETVVVKPLTDDRWEQFSVKTAHKSLTGDLVAMKLAEESDGTRRLLDLIPALYSLGISGGVCFVDEIDRSLHPMLVRNFLEHFLRTADRGQRQLIMTTHESNLLDQDLLRRDEIWFAEKDPAGATHLYSLMDFKVRNDLEIRKHYLQGRFGAVPFLGDPARLPAETNQPA